MNKLIDQKCSALLNGHFSSSEAKECDLDLDPIWVDLIFCLQNATYCEPLTKFDRPQKFCFWGPFMQRGSLMRGRWKNGSL